jgi:hypothetical protein
MSHGKTLGEARLRRDAGIETTEIRIGTHIGVVIDPRLGLSDPWMMLRIQRTSGSQGVSVVAAVTAAREDQQVGQSDGEEVGL